MDWRERMLESVPAWVAVMVSFGVLVAGWALFAPDDERAPLGVKFLALILLMPAIGRASHVAAWRAAGFVASLVLAVVVSGWIGPFAVWLLVVVALTAPPAYWLIDRAWASPWEGHSPVGEELK